MNINLNERVKVKLNDFGIKILKQDHDETNRLLKERGGKGHPFILRLDEEGYYEAQLWYLMLVFGPHLCNGNENPFDSDLIFDKEDDNQTDLSKLKVLVQKAAPSSELIKELQNIRGIEIIESLYPQPFIKYTGYMPE
jgi:hypothetical protein